MAATSLLKQLAAATPGLAVLALSIWYGIQMGSVWDGLWTFVTLMIAVGAITELIENGAWKYLVLGLVLAFAVMKCSDMAQSSGVCAASFYEAERCEE